MVFFGNCLSYCWLFRVDFSGWCVGCVWWWGFGNCLGLFYCVWLNLDIDCCNRLRSDCWEVLIMDYIVFVFGLVEFVWGCELMFNLNFVIE